jgi:hypothetical protein
MLWQKGWLETRFRLLFTLGMTLFVLSVQRSAHMSSVPPAHADAAVLSATARANAVILSAMTFANAIPLIVVCAMLAGAGIATQPSFQAAKGVHGSCLFTLSLPVSRLRLLATRAAVGWLELVAEIAILCCGTWLVSPLLRQMATPTEMAEYAVTLVACGSALYCLSVLLATFLDDQWRTWGTMIAACTIAWISNHASLPASIDIVQAIGKNSPIIAHTVPWSAMAFAVALAAALFVAALKIAQSREY